MYKISYFENCALLGYYAERSGNLLPTSGGNLLVPSSGVKNLDSCRWDVWIIIKIIGHKSGGIL